MSGALSLRARDSDQKSGGKRWREVEFSIPIPDRDGRATASSERAVGYGLVVK